MAVYQVFRKNKEWGHIVQSDWLQLEDYGLFSKTVMLRQAS